MSIKSICKTKVITVEKDASLKSAASIMAKEHVGSVIVTEALNGKRKPTGIITDRDIALSFGATAKPQDLRVEQVMRLNPVTAKTSDGIYDTINKMKEYGIRRVPVVSEDGALYGMLCADDLLALVGDEVNNLAKIFDAQVKNEQSIRSMRA